MFKEILSYPFLYRGGWIVVVGSGSSLNEKFKELQSCSEFYHQTLSLLLKFPYRLFDIIKFEI